MYYFLGVVGAIVMYWFMGALVKSPGRVLSNNFAKLGDMTGKTYDEIKAVVGPCNSVSYMHNSILRQWYATGYHIVLLFDKNDVFIKIESETAV